jgi:NAD(P)-dependent dehydrogenase (short-subunit alcohol dehydrogenase family)
MPANRPILITGCSSGIGYCVAHGLKKRGYQVFASARQAQDVVRLRNEGLDCVQLDLDDDASIARALDEVLSQSNGRLYGLFNNGAYGQPGAVEDLSRSALRAQLETNLLGWHELTRRVIPVMRAAGEGRIIQNSSILGFVGLPYRGAYNCSKFALEGLTDTLRLELAHTGIQVSLIEPGPISSRFRDNARRAFAANIDAEHSPHRDKYRAMQARLEKVGPAAPFTLPPEAVLAKVVHALESRRARPRYYVTVPTYLLGYLKRVLSSRAFDRLLRAVSGGGSR